MFSVKRTEKEKKTKKNDDDDEAPFEIIKSKNRFKRTNMFDDCLHGAMSFEDKNKFAVLCSEEENGKPKMKKTTSTS